MVHRITLLPKFSEDTITVLGSVYVLHCNVSTILKSKKISSINDNTKTEADQETFVKGIAVSVFLYYFSTNKKEKRKKIFFVILPQRLL